MPGVFVLALILLLLGVPARNASAVTLVNPDGSEAEPYTTWAGGSSIPLPRGKVIISNDLAICGRDSVDGCMSGNTLVLSDGLSGVRREQAFFHELGHWFDFEWMNHRDRRYFCAVTNMSCRKWFSADYSITPPGEHFADYFRWIAIFDTWSYFSTTPNADLEFGYQRIPTAKEWTILHRRMNRVGRRR